MDKIKDPYVAFPDRLSDVLAAIQAMDTYDFHMCSFERWAVQISGDASRADHWKRVLEDHPEFFRLDTTRKKASLVWRRQYPRLYHVDRRETLTKKEYAALPQADKERVSRTPLEPPDIKTLIDAAIGLHARAVETQRESRWWIPLVSAIGGAILGAAAVIIGALLKK